MGCGSSSDATAHDGSGGADEKRRDVHHHTGGGGGEAGLCWERSPLAYPLRVRGQNAPNNTRAALHCEPATAKYFADPADPGAIDTTHEEPERPEPRPDEALIIDHDDADVPAMAFPTLTELPCWGLSNGTVPEDSCEFTAALRREPASLDDDDDDADGGNTGGPALPHCVPSRRDEPSRAPRVFAGAQLPPTASRFRR